MNNIMIVALISLFAGGLLAWLIRKLIFEKGHVPLAEYNSLNDKYQQTNTRLAIMEEKQRTQMSELADLKQRAIEMEKMSMLQRESLAAERTALGILNGEKENLLQETLSIRQQLQIKTDEWMAAKNESTELKTKLEHQSTLYQDQKRDLEQMTEKMRKDFSLLAQDILDEKTKKFNESQQKEMSVLLEPLKTNLTEFRTQVEKSYKIENDDRLSLKEQVKLMMQLNETLAKEAKSLSVALSGNTKKQGDWGEWILETILEYSGLQKGVHFFPQESSNDDEGNRIRSDVIVKYPDERVLIIDSKVSLSHYDQLCREEDPDTQVLLLNRLIQSLRNHIDGLSGKNYTQFKNSLDMVIMFLPVEVAYITALQNDPDLQHYAYRKNVLMVSPANLVVAMKLIFDMWKKDAINKNAEAVADSAGKLYDKLAGFVDDFTKIGRALEGMQSTYNDAHKKLASGKGNIISRAEKMKQLEIKATRSIAGGIANEALLEEE
jgi:DNA recombination protein RmuC